ncbi:MAG: GIY-YIG nuclease family protein [Flavobacteriaceae bacterium]|nr:GIY-YIG nuclease family protein [Flavobacteriaceae bacterium]
MRIFFVYIIECSDKTFYIGVTKNLEERIRQHNAGLNRDSYIFKRRPVELKWFESFTNPEEAFKIEKQLKGWSRRKKIALINEEWEKLVEYSKNYTQNKSSTGSN